MPRQPARPSPSAPPAAAAAAPEPEAAAVMRTTGAISPLDPMPPVPDGWAAKADLVDACIGMGRRLSLWIAVLVFRARADFAEPGEWVDACTGRWEWQKAQLHHMARVGELLCRNTGRVWHATLIGLDSEKLLSISRLPERLVAPFVEKARPEAISRDECRAAVNRWLAAAGEPSLPPTTKPVPRKPPAQPDFLDQLFAAASDDQARDRLVADPTPPRRAALAGLALVDVAVRKYAACQAPDADDLEAMIEDLQRTTAAVRAMLAAATRERLGMPPTAMPALADREDF